MEVVGHYYTGRLEEGMKLSYGSYLRRGPIKRRRIEVVGHHYTRQLKEGMKALYGS